MSKIFWLRRVALFKGSKSDCLVQITKLSYHQLTGRKHMRCVTHRSLRRGLRASVVCCSFRRRRRTACSSSVVLRVHNYARPAAFFSRVSAKYYIFRYIWDERPKSQSVVSTVFLLPSIRCECDRVWSLAFCSVGIVRSRLITWLWQSVCDFVVEIADSPTPSYSSFLQSVDLQHCHSLGSWVGAVLYNLYTHLFSHYFINFFVLLSARFIF